MKVYKSLDLRGQRATNAGDASAATDLVTLQQVQAFVRGLDWKDSVRAASTGNLNLAAPGATIDGVTMAAGNRFLAKDQSTGSQNGIYVWNGAAAAATRAVDADSSAEVTSGMAVTVTEGTTNGDKTFTLTTNDPITLDTTSLSFTQLGGGGTTYNADGNGIELSGSTFSIELDGTTLTKSASGLRIGSGAAGAGLTESSGVLAVGQGTGITVNADDVAINTSVVARKFAADCAATTNPQTFTHALGTDVEVQVWEGNELVICDITKSATSGGQVTVDFGIAPTAAQFRVVVHG